MIDFTDEQKMAQKMVRQWTDKELAPHVAEMEKGEILPYDIMRKLIAAFGMDEMVRAQFEKLERRSESGRNDGRGIGDPGLMAIVAMELSRVCPGFCLAFGASLGLAGGAIMAKGTLAQKQRWALPILTMREDRRLGHDRARRRLRRVRLHAHHGAPRRRRLRLERAEDLHHQRAVSPTPS